MEKSPLLRSSYQGRDLTTADPTDLTSPISQDLSHSPRIPSLTLDVKGTSIYTPKSSRCSPHATHYKLSSNLNREFVKGGFGLYRVNAWGKGVSEVYDVRVISDTRFNLLRISGDGQEDGEVACERKWSIKGWAWDVLQSASCASSDGEKRAILLRARRMPKDDGGCLGWYDGQGRLLAKDSKLRRRRGTCENGFEMPVLTFVPGREMGEAEVDLLVACWLTKVWVEVERAKRRGLLDVELACAWKR
jgi:hypothetical protein